MSRNQKKPREHAKVERHVFAGLAWRTGPLSLLIYAEDFLAASKSSTPADPRFQPARLFLACRAIELALKAFLSLREISLMNIMDRKHYLKRLLIEAEKLGLEQHIKLQQIERDLISQAAIYYEEKVFEYPSLTEALVGYPEMPRLDGLFDIARRLVDALKEPCLAA
jgi:hypothetical protein